MEYINAYEILRKSINSFEGDIIEALNKVSYAVLKQTQKKPFVAQDDEDQWLECPTCGSYLDSIFHSDYCGDCGQFIDWSEFIEDEELYIGEEDYLDHIDIYCE